MADVELHTLGECRIVVGRECIGPQSPHAFALSLYLCIERGRPHPRDALLALFFPDAETDKGRHSLRQSVYKLRQLGIPCETTSAGTIVPASAVRDDFTSLLATAELPDLSADRLPGEFLPGFWPKISLEYTRWLEAQRDAINGALRRAYITRIADRRSVARWDHVERYARACLSVDPLNEEATLALAEALALSGSKAAGVKVLDDYLVEVGSSGTPLTLPAATLRRRISERVVGRSSLSSVPLVGREMEMTLLADTYARARNGAQASLWFYGEPGIGKSRLLHDFADRMAVTGHRVVKAFCKPYDGYHRFSAVKGLASQLIAVPGALGASPASLATIRGLVGDGRDMADSDVAAMASLPLAAGALIDALNDLLDALTTERLLIVVWDDAHWMDDFAQQILSAVLSERRSRPLLFIIFSRFEPPAFSFSPAAVQQVRVGRLPEAKALELLQEGFRIAHVSVPTETAYLAARLGAGNPFVLRILIDHFASNPNTAEVPAKVKILIEQRLASVSVCARMVLRACVLLGAHSTVRRLEVLVDMPRHQLWAALDELGHAGLAVFADGRLRAVHDLLAEFILGESTTAADAIVDYGASRLLEEEAEANGRVDLYCAAAHSWRIAGNTAGVQRCLERAATIDHITHILHVVDTSGPSEMRQDLSTPVGGLYRRLSDDDRRHYALARGAKTLGVLPTDKICVAVTDPASLTPDTLVRFCRDERNGVGARLRAAVAAIAIAEDNGDAQLAAQAYRAAVAVRGEIGGPAKVDLQRMHLAYHTCFGQQSVALNLAGEIEASFGEYDDPYTAVRAAVNAAEAFTRCGETDRGVLLLDSAFDLSLRDGLTESAGLVATRAVWCVRQVNDTCALALWSGRAADTNREGCSSYASHLYNLALLSIDGGDDSEFTMLAEEVAHRFASSKNRHHQALVSGLLLRVDIRYPNRGAFTGDIADLERWSLLHAPINPNDDVALAVAEHLRAKEGSVAARLYVERYFRSRREQTYPVHVHLLTFASSLEQ